MSYSELKTKFYKSYIPLPIVLDNVRFTKFSVIYKHKILCSRLYEECKIIYVYITQVKISDWNFITWINVTDFMLIYRKVYLILILIKCRGKLF